MSDKSEGQEWVLVGLDEQVARRAGLPFQVPVPKEKFESLADEGLPGDKLDGWVKGFLENAPVAKDGNWRRRNSTLVSQLEGYVDKKPLWAKAQKLFDEREFDKAIKTLKRITVMCPDDHAAKMNYASALANMGKHDKAFKQLRQVRDTFKGEADYHVTLAQIFVALDRQDDAINELVTGLESQPDHLPSMDALAKMGVLARIYEDPRDASSLTFVRADAVLEYLQERWSSEERDIDYYLQQLAYHERERRYHVAIAAADAAIEKSGDTLCDRAETAKVSCLRAMGQKDQALAAAKALAAKAPESVGAQVELAASLEANGDKDGAAAAIDKALELDPGDQQALAEKFWPDDRESLLEVQEAIPGLQAYVDANPEVAGAKRSLARAKLVTGADEEALALFEEAVKLTPDDDDLRSEWWAELAAKGHHDKILTDAKRFDDITGRDWRLRWNEAEAYRANGKLMEARACYMQINSDESLHVDIRKRAKRASMEMGQAPGDAQEETTQEAADE